MAKIYLSDLMLNGATVNRSADGGQKFDVTGNVRIPAGTVLTSADKILIARFPTGTVFNQIVAVFPDLDSTTALTLDVGYDRPVTDPSKAYNATTNPYITGAIATADVDFFEEDSTVGQAGGTLSLGAASFTVTTSPVSAGFVDVSVTPVVSSAASAADGTIKFMIEALVVADNQPQGEFSGADALDYNTNYVL